MKCVFYVLSIIIVLGLVSPCTCKTPDRARSMAVVWAAATSDAVVSSWPVRMVVWYETYGR